ncbi:hypothetical protein Tco_1559892, partial [Tanacetum coccineum]
VNLVRSILGQKKDGNEWEDWSSLFISGKELVSTSLIRVIRGGSASTSHRTSSAPESKNLPLRRPSSPINQHESHYNEQSHTAILQK